MVAWAALAFLFSTFASVKYPAIDLSDDAVAIVVKLMSKSPAQRYQSANELIADIDQVLAGVAPQRAGIAANESSIRPTRRPRKKRVARSEGCLGMLLLAGIGVLLFWDRFA